MGIGFPEFLQVLEHLRQGQERRDTGSVAVRAGIQGSGERADVVVVGGDHHIPVPAAGEEAHDIVRRAAGDGAETAEISAAGGFEAIGRKLAGDGRLRVQGAWRPGGPAGAEAVGEEGYTGAETVFIGQVLGVAGADKIAGSLRSGEGRQGGKREAEAQKFSGQSSDGHDKCLSL